MMRGLPAILALLLVAGVAHADTDIVALSPQARAAAIGAAADRGDSLTLGGDPRRIHGEMGMEIGTGGHRALWGSATVPIGQTGSATFAFLSSQANGGRR